MWGGGIFYPREFYDACDEYHLRRIYPQMAVPVMQIPSLHLLCPLTLLWPGRYGVLVYHDMQYASTGGGTHGPIASTEQELELRHQIRRLSHHPSIVLWDGANEVGDR